MRHQNMKRIKILTIIDEIFQILVNRDDRLPQDQVNNNMASINLLAVSP